MISGMHMLLRCPFPDRWKECQESWHPLFKERGLYVAYWAADVYMVHQISLLELGIKLNIKLFHLYKAWVCELVPADIR
jgi:hypothetical protein